MAWTIADIARQDGRVAVVTGGNSGIGYDTCLELARAGASVILSARNRARGEEAVSRIRRADPAAKIRFELLDLDSLRSVASFSERMTAVHSRIDLLINNAGVMALPTREISADGFERQFGINFLGHFAMTAHLLPLLRAAEAPRAVQLSSLAHRRGRIDFDNLQGERHYSPTQAYSQSKLAMLMFGIELGRRADAAGWNVISTSAHPGWAATSLIVNGMGKGMAGRIANWTFPLLAQSSHAGAWPTLYAATAPDVVQGGYYGPTGKGERKGPPGPATIFPQALDEDVAARLWSEAERLTGVTLTLA